MTLLALDIGGANLKAADGLGFAWSQPFSLWLRPQDLATELGKLLAAAPQADRVLATMTGELCDCFATKRDGVQTIIAALVEATAGREVLVYLTDGRFVSSAEADGAPHLAAASNWHALARLAGRWAREGTGLLIDIGSTTTDIIPLVDGQPVAAGRTDTERLATGELVYTGVVRSPLCAVVSSLPWRGRYCRVAQELFATTWDAYLLLGRLPEEPDARHTADSRPATRAAAHNRLARAVCADREEFDERDAQLAAEAIATAQRELLVTAAREVVARLPAPPATVIVSGQGEFLAREVAVTVAKGANIVSLAEQLGPAVSQVAPAHALAMLGREEDMVNEGVPGPPSRTGGEMGGRRVVARRVVKLGGSLLALGDCLPRVERWLGSQPPLPTLLIVGGGAAVEGIRTVDRQQPLDDTLAHWLAIAAMTVQGRAVAEELEVPFVEWSAWIDTPPGNTCAVLDAWQFMWREEPRLSREPLPASWNVTSDSIAACAAAFCGASLVLLKSCLPTSPHGPADWSAQGYVDRYFPVAARGVPEIFAVDLRTNSTTTMSSPGAA